MSLFSSMSVGLSALQSQMAALQTTGHNIANANTPGYVRQRVNMEAYAPQDWQFAQLGTGVRVAKIQRVVDEMLTMRIQTSTSTLSNYDVNRQTMERLEAVFNELSEEGANISTAMSKFFTSLDDLANNPEKASAREQVVQNAGNLSDTFNSIATRITEMREGLESELQTTVKDVNRLASQIAQLNESIVSSENGGNDPDTANDLRDRRDLLLQELSEKINIKPIETGTGAVNVLVGTSFIVFNKTSYEVALSTTTDRGILASTPYIVSSGAQLDVRSGALKGMLDGRDSILTGYSDGLDELAKGLMFELNKVHSEGTGLSRYKSLTSAESVLNPALANSPLAVSGSVLSTTAKYLSSNELKGYAVDQFNGMEIMATSGANKGQRRIIKDFDGVAGSMLMDKAFDFEFASGDSFQVTSFHYPVKNGSFNLKVTNDSNGAEQVFNIDVDLDGVGTDSNLTSIVNEINTKAGSAGISASITSDNKLKLQTSTTGMSFSFGDDSSDLLAAMGINTFFKGEDAASMSVSELIEGNTNYLAAGRSNNPTDNANALAMAALKGSNTMQDGMATFEDYYQGIVGTMAVDTSTAKDLCTSQESLSLQMENERQRVSGVNLDEEAVNLIEYQRAYQAAARYISVIDGLIQTLLETV